MSEAEEIEDVTDQLYADETVDNSSEEMTKTVNLNTIQTTDALGQWETHTKVSKVDLLKFTSSLVEMIY